MLVQFVDNILFPPNLLYSVTKSNLGIPVDQNETYLNRITFIPLSSKKTKLGSKSNISLVHMVRVRNKTGALGWVLIGFLYRHLDFSFDTFHYRRLHSIRRVSQMCRCSLKAAVTVTLDHLEYMLYSSLWRVKMSAAKKSTSGAAVSKFYFNNCLFKFKCNLKFWIRSFCIQSKKLVKIR